MIRKILYPVLILPVVFAFMAGTPAQARVYELYTPDPIVVPKSKSARVNKAIKKVLFRRNWRVKTIKSGHYRATYTKPGRGGRMHKAVVDVIYKGGKIRVKYVDSRDLNYDKESNTIHGAYNRWVQNIEKDLLVELELF